MMVKALASMNMVTGEVMPPVVMVSRGWLVEEVGDAASNSCYAAT